MRHAGLFGSGFIVFSRDGRSLISRCVDGIVHFWDPTTGRELPSGSLPTSCFEGAWTRHPFLFQKKWPRFV